jgi:predicted transcriptional regulator
MTSKEMSDVITAVILGMCYENQTSYTRIEYQTIAQEYIDDIDQAGKVSYVFEWLEREGLVRCMHKRKSQCIDAEITSKGKRLLRENDTGTKLVQALTGGAISIATSLVAKVIDSI